MTRAHRIEEALARALEAQDQEPENNGRGERCLVVTLHPGDGRSENELIPLWVLARDMERFLS